MPDLHSNIREIGRGEEGFEVALLQSTSHRFWKELQNRSHHPFSGTPAPSTTEDPTTASLFAEDKSLNASKAKAGGGMTKPRLAPVQLRTLEAEKEKEVARGGGGTMRLGGNYCFVLTKRGQYDVAEGFLRRIMVSNMYQTQDHQNSIRIALISTTIPSLSPLSSLTAQPTTRSVLAEQPNFVVEQARKLITTASIQQRASQDSSRNRRERA
ncbi:hypothetical protein BJ165DRAFT_1530810 [Panaeolus papilionaceus]|nr:hypothetical protein BJ165DRAFT_1530810 [Panaeolus papilionaceus]